MAAKDELGRRGEDVAVQYLEGQGLTVLSRNWRCRHGELDVVATDAQRLVVCEVKTRRSLAYGHPAEAVTPIKQQRIRGLAARWLREEAPGPVGEVRFDVASSPSSEIWGVAIAAYTWR